MPFKVIRMTPASEFKLDPPIRLRDGRTIRTAADAIILVREHEMRPGVDDRDEVLHALERATSDEHLAKAVARFRAWLITWGSTVPVAVERGSTRGPTA
jgi:hypothetical protein